jgi:hypothetical protein
MRPTFVDSLIQIVARSVFFSTATPHPEKITPTPKGVGANARLVAGVASSGCRAGGRKTVHLGGLLCSAAFVVQMNQRLAVVPTNI